MQTSALLAALLLTTAGQSTAQESSSKTGIGTSTSSGPSAALRDALSAACSQSQNEFARFLTERNKESFSRMAAATRVALMKRFVLLNEPGKASVITNPAGRPTVRCVTPAGTAEIQIGGVQLDDNLAFLPVELRDASDSAGADAMHVKLGLIRENGEWKLLSLGLVLLDLPALEMEWDTADIDKNEQGAIDALKKIADAVEVYRRKYSRLPETFWKLGPPLQGAPTGEAAGLLDSDLATGVKGGYAFRYVILGGSTLGAPAEFELAATPVSYGRTGRRSFFRDAAGVLRGADRQGAIGNKADPRVP